MHSQRKQRNCPLVKEPMAECFCLNMTSININRAIYYCSGDYKKCYLYREYSRVLSDLANNRSSATNAGSVS
jgi:hypothetical protein